MTDRPLEPPSRKAAWTQRLIGLVVLAAAIYLLDRLVSDVGWGEVRNRLAEARLPLLSIAVVCLVGQLALWAARQRLSVRRITETPPGWIIFLALVATAAANFLLPFARLLGGLLRARYLSRASSPLAPKRIYYAAVLFDQAVHFLMMGTLTLAGLIGGAIVLGRPALAAGLGAALVLALGIGYLWVRRSLGLKRDGRPGLRGGGLARFLERRAERQEGVFGRLLAGSETAARIFLRLVRNVPLWGQALALGAALFLFLATAQWVVFYSLGTTVNPFVVVATVTLGLSAGMLLGTPGGLGTAEATMIALYGAFGVDRVDAASAVLLFRGLQFAVVLGLGLPSMAILEAYSAVVRRRPDGELHVEEAVRHAGRG